MKAESNDQDVPNEEPSHKPYKYVGTFGGKKPVKETPEDTSRYAGIVSTVIEEVLRTSKVGRQFAESSPSIRKALEYQ